MYRNKRLWWALVLVYGLMVPSTVALQPAMTPEKVQRKAVVIKDDAKLYEKARGDAGEQALFMQVYFRLEGESGGRVPVTRSPNKTEADGWLEKGSFAEWNTIQMIHFEPQSGRELVRIFAKADCADEFGRSGETGCEDLGREPQRAGKQRDDYRLLVPVFERQNDNYQGGFVRVAAEGPVVEPVVDGEVGRSKQVSGHLGYDLVLAVDATASMEQWFRPTTEVLRNFIRTVRSAVGSGEQSAPFNVGLLFYRDRKKQPDCDIGFLTHWAMELTDDIEGVARALDGAQKAECGSDEINEAVFDGLNRAVQDPKWNDGHFKVVLLVGDAPPHAVSDREKNPMGLDVTAITKLSGESNIRFLTFMIGPEDPTAFKNLALSVREEVQGRFRHIRPDPDQYKQALAGALQEEWELLGLANRYIDAKKPLEEVPGIDAYDLPIILANLPPGAGGKKAPEFVQGWVPKKIKDKRAMGEFVFMTKNHVKRFANVIETVALAAEDGKTEGSDAFLKSLRSALSTMLNVPPDQLFKSGESLHTMMQKAELLPFKTTVLSFTAEEINTWTPADYERLNKILTEKTGLLREHIQRPGNLRLFGDKPHVYVPRDLFP